MRLARTSASTGANCTRLGMSAHVVNNFTAQSVDCPGKHFFGVFRPQQFCRFTLGARRASWRMWSA